ncbi:hypothetical protein L9F63_014288, partial [Diploptera punctata]
ILHLFLTTLSTSSNFFKFHILLLKISGRSSHFLMILKALPAIALLLIGPPRTGLRLGLRLTEDDRKWTSLLEHEIYAVRKDANQMLDCDGQDMRFLGNNNSVTGHKKVYIMKLFKMSD